MPVSRLDLLTGGRPHSNAAPVGVSRFRVSDYQLYDVAVDEWAGFVFVNLGGGGQEESLADALGHQPARFRNYRMDELRLGHRIVIEVEANWKFMIENFYECFHCPNVHPELSAIVPAIRAGMFGPQNPDWQPPHPGATGWEVLPGMVTFTMDGQAVGPLLRGLNEEERDRPYSAGMVAPSFFLNAHPDFVHVHRMLPKGPTRMEMTYDWLFEPSTTERSDFDINHAVELWDITNRQDCRSLEYQQQGLRYRQHERNTYVPQESGPFRIVQWVLRELGEIEDGPTTP